MSSRANLSDVLNVLMQELLHLRTVEETNLQVNVQVLAHLTQEDPEAVYTRVAALRSDIYRHALDDWQKRFPEVFEAFSSSLDEE